MTPSPAGVGTTLFGRGRDADGELGVGHEAVQEARRVGLDAEAQHLASVAVADEGAEDAALWPDRELELALAEVRGEVDEARAVGEARPVGTEDEDGAVARGDEQVPLRREVHAVGLGTLREAPLGSDARRAREQHDLGRELGRRLSERHLIQEGRDLRRGIAQQRRRIAGEHEQVAAIEDARVERHDARLLDELDRERRRDAPDRHRDLDVVVDRADRRRVATRQADSGARRIAA